MLDGFLTVMLGEEDINIQNDAIYTSKLEGRIEGSPKVKRKGRRKALPKEWAKSLPEKTGIGCRIDAYLFPATL
ncbi:hypothetical protein ACPYIV_13795 [Parabacteroides sp. ASD2025]|uniref:hypothetical protein n=1 Tax=Parabacteroides sp. ASD2025 TaxID=3415987 RepID=UPI003CF48129